MTKAKKGLIITLFAAMMIFAFGATSAFAADSYNADGAVWNSNFTKATINGQEYDTTLSQHTFTQGGNSYDMIRASVTIVGDRTYNAYFIDVTNANLYDVQNAPVTASRTYNSYTTYLGQGTTMYVQTVKPDYFTGSWTTVNPQNLRGYETTVATPLVYPAAKGDNITIEADIESTNGTTDGAATDPFLIGTNPTGVVTLSTPSSAITHAGWFVDAAEDGNEYSANLQAYDGFDHTLIYASPATNVEVVGYEARNNRGEWDSVDTIPFKDVVTQADNLRYRAVVETTTVNGNTVTVTTSRVNLLYLVVNPTDAQPAVTWLPSNNWGPTVVRDNTTFYQLTKEQAADPSAYLVFENGFVAKAADPFDVVGNVEADMDQIKAYFDALYEITVTNYPANDELQTWEVTPRVLTPSERAEINKQFATLIKNYGFGIDEKDLDVPEGVINVAVVANPAVDIDTNADIVDFTFAPTTKTYHVKKAKKLKKTKSFTVEASAKSGKAVTYVLKTPSKKIKIDPATGKITVKKGIKKGSYKIKVTARTEKGNGFAAAQDVANITIKIKK